MVRLMEQERRYGMIRDNMKENGNKVSITGMGGLFGQMDENIMGCLRTIKSMDMVHTLGQMESPIAECGKMVNSMEKEY